MAGKKKTTKKAGRATTKKTTANKRAKADGDRVPIGQAIAAAKDRAAKKKPKKGKAAKSAAVKATQSDQPTASPEVFERLGLPTPVTMTVRVDDIEPDPRNARATPHTLPDIKDMAAALESAGQLQPIGVVSQKGKVPYRLVWGELRWLGAEAAGLKTLEARVFPAGMTDEQVATAQAVENFARRDATVLDEAMAVDRLSQGRASLGQLSDVDVKRIAQRLGWHERRVRRAAKLIRLPAAGEAARLLAEGRLTINQAQAIATLADPKLQDEVARLAARRDDGEGGWTEYATSRWCLEHRQSLRGVPWELGVEFAGKPACTTCPHNAKNNRGLFDELVLKGKGWNEKHKLDVDDGLGEGDPGKCLLASCFDVKQRTAEQRLKSAVSKAQKTMVPLIITAAKDVKKKTEGARPISVTATTLEREGLMPEGLKPSTVVNQVRKAVEPMLGAKGVSAKGEAETGPKLNGLPGPDLTGKAGRGKVQADPHEVAKQRCDEAVKKWHDDLVLAMRKSLCEVAGRRSMLASFLDTVMYGHRLFAGYFSAGDGNERVAKVLKSPDVREALARFKSPSIEDLAAIENDIPAGRDGVAIGDPIEGAISDMDFGVVKALVEAMGVEVPPKPELETFLKEIGIEPKAPKGKAGGKKGKAKAAEASDDDAAADEAMAQAERQRDEFEREMGEGEVA